MKTATRPDYDILFFPSEIEWHAWLTKHNGDVAGVWLKFAKKGSGIISLHYPEALDVALCYGWIDGQSRSFDDSYYLQKFTPRGKKSIWSKINTVKVERLINEGKMKPSGMRAVEAAKADGRWERAYAPASKMEMPEDFLKELANDKEAEAFFESLSKTNKFAIGFRLHGAKKPETREKRMRMILTMLKEKQKFH